MSFQNAPSARKRRPKVALIHDWLVGQRGGEQVLLALCRLFTDATIYTLVHRPKSVSAQIESHRIVTSAIERLSWPHGRFRHLLPLFFPAMARFDLSSYDLVISSSHCVAHAVNTGPHQLHLGYVHTPMRYLYDQMATYLPVKGRLASEPIARVLTAPLRRLDRQAGQRVDRLLANSAYVARRIAKHWGCDAQVVYPPIDVEAFVPPVGNDMQAPRKGLVWVGALVPYKRADIAIALARETGLSLTIVGDGPLRAQLQAAAPAQVHFVGRLSQENLRQLYWRSEAMIFAGIEDFGMAPVEAMAAGCPVLALGAGGLAESVLGSGPKQTGVLVSQPTVEAFAAGYRQLVAARSAGLLAPDVLASHAKTFGAHAFAEGIVAQIAPWLGQHGFAVPLLHNNATA